MIDKITANFNELINWVRYNNITLLVLGTISVITFVGTLILVPILVVRLPDDYFAHQHRHRKPWPTIHPFLRTILLIGKNLLGIILLCAGIVMLVLPGQGILTILIGMTLIDFPGKFYFERRLVTRKPVLQSINWLRQRAGRGELLIKETNRKR